MTRRRWILLGIVAIGAIVATCSYRFRRVEKHEHDWRLATDGHFQQDFKGEKQ